MEHYRITHWEEAFEVDQHGRPWKPGHPVRKGPLQFLRVKCRKGTAQRFNSLMTMYGPAKSYAAMGVFERLCQLVGCEDGPNRRGGALRYDGQLASLRQIGLMLSATVDQIEPLIDILLDPDVGWLTAFDVEDQLPVLDEGVGANQCEQTQPDLVRAAEGSRPPEPECPRGRSRGQCAPAREDGQEACVSEPKTPVVCAQAHTEVRGPVRARKVKSQESRSRQETLTEKTQGQSQASANSVGLDLDLERGGSGGLVLTMTLAERVKWRTRLHNTLRLHERREVHGVSDVNAAMNALSAFEGWVYETSRDGEMYEMRVEEALRIAKDCGKARVPFACWMARVQQFFEYIPPSRRASYAQAT